MIATFKNSKAKQFVFVEVPEDSGNYEVNNWLKTVSWDNYETGSYDDWVGLPYSNYEIIGLAKDLTEEQWKDIIVEPKDDSPLWWIGRLLLDLFGFKISDNVLILEVTE